MVLLNVAYMHVYLKCAFHPYHFVPSQRRRLEVMALQHICLKPSLYTLPSCIVIMPSLCLPICITDNLYIFCPHVFPLWFTVGFYGIYVARLFHLCQVYFPQQRHFSTELLSFSASKKIAAAF